MTKFEKGNMIEEWSEYFSFASKLKTLYSKIMLQIVWLRGSLKNY